MSRRFVLAESRDAALTAAAAAVADGELIVLPTDTVYGIGADAFSPLAVQRLLDAKGRTRQMPPPVLVASVEVLAALADVVTPQMTALAQEFWPGALTIICRARTSLMWDLGETHGTVAIRVPDSDEVRELLGRTGPLAVSSANTTGAAAATTVYQAEQMLGSNVAVYLDGGDLAGLGGGVASTIVDLTGAKPTIVRHGAISADELAQVLPDIAGGEPQEPPSA